MAARSHLEFFNRHGLASTHWTTIRACKTSDATGQAARERLCRDYWYPLYAYIKRLGHQGYDAEDLTQDFFAHILSRPWFEHADRAKGKFRSFLFTSLDNFLHDCLQGKMARKRGGSYQHIPLDLGSAESRYVQSASTRLPPTAVYDTEWAVVVVDTAWKRLHAEYAGTGKHALFEQLKGFLANSGDADRHAETARVLGLSTTNLKVNIHRLRKRYGAILREEVARTVASLEDVPEEMQYIRAAFETKAMAAA